MAPKTVTPWPKHSYTTKYGSKQQSVGNWEAFIGVGFGWGVGFSTLYLIHVLYVDGFQTSFYTLSYVKDKTKFILILDINDQNVTCVSVFEGTQVAYLELKPLITTSTYASNPKSTLEE